MVWPVIALVVLRRAPATSRVDRFLQASVHALAVIVPATAGVTVLAHSWRPSSPGIAIAAGAVLWLGIILGGLGVAWLSGRWVSLLLPYGREHDC
jgi:uncharacterized membrane protein YadS